MTFVVRHEQLSFRPNANFAMSAGRAMGHLGDKTNLIAEIRISFSDEAGMSNR